MSTLIAPQKTTIKVIGSFTQWRFCLALLSLLFVLTGSSLIHAHPSENFPPSSLIWTGSVDSDWATAGNWSPASVPTASDDVRIPNTGNAPVINGLTAAVAKSVVVEVNAQLTISASGSLTIDGADFDGLVNEGTISNSGTLIIGPDIGEFSAGISNRGTFINVDACSVFRLSSSFESFVTFTNNGLLSVDTDKAHNVFGTFDNNGVIEYGQQNPIPGVINNGLVITPVKFIAPDCGLPQAGVLGVGGSNAFTVSTAWYKDEAQTESAGTYEQGSNTFTPAAAPPAPSTLYFTVSNGGCTHDVAISYSAQAVDDTTPATWMGLSSSDWTEPCNWSPGLVPGDNTRVVIAPSINGCQVPAGENASANSVAIEVGASLTVDLTGALTVVGDTISIENFGTLTNNGEIYITRSSDSENAITNYGTLTNNFFIDIFKGSTGVAIETGSSFNNIGAILIDGAAVGFIIIEDCQNDGAIVCSGNAAGVYLLTNSFINSTTGDIEIFDSSIYGLGCFTGTFTNNGELDIESDELGLSVEIGEFINGPTGTIETTGRIAGVNVDGGALQNNGSIETSSRLGQGIRIVDGPATNDGSILINDTGGHAVSVRSNGTLTNRSTINIGQSDGVEDNIDDHGIDNSGTFNNQGTINIDNIGEDGINHSGGSFLNTGDINIGMGLVKNITRYGFRASAGFTNEGTINIDHTDNAAIRLSTTFSLNRGNINVGQNSTGGTVGMLLDQNAELLNLLAGDVNIQNYATGLKTDASGGTFTNNGGLSFENNSTYAVESQSDFVSDGLISGEGEYLLPNSELGGVLSPGFSPGTLSFTNDLEFSESSLLIIEIQGTAANAFDQILGGGDIDISNSTLNATITYTPTDGDRIVILSSNSITGTFQSISPALPAGWFVDYTVTGEVALVFNAALPVELLYFDVSKKAETVVLDWQTASESNNRGFDILHSTDGLTWRNIRFVAGNGNAQESNSYTFTHSAPVIGNNYYRLRQLDFDGQFSDSAIRTVKFDGPTAGFELQVYPNPTTDYTQIHLPALHAQGQLLVANTAGHTIYSTLISEEQQQIQLDLQDWPAGTYLIHLQLGQSTSTLKLVRTKT
ncbi:MAG: T9SS type A sorting domain-containing protein [Bacteroidota bacterium]